MLDNNAFQPQVDASHYASRAYNSKPRLASFWHQVDEVLEAGGGSVLEVGPGSGQVTSWLRRSGVEVTTLDADRAVAPDIEGSVIAMPVDDDAYDVVLCAEVLEHLSISDARTALRELARVARKKVIVSVPDLRPFVGVPYPLYFGPYIDRVRAQIPAGRVRPLLAALRGRARWRDALFIALVPAEWSFGGPVAEWHSAPVPHIPWRHEFDGEHHWEIGVDGTPIERVRAWFGEAGMELERDFRVPEHPWHHFFVARVP